MPLLDVFAAQNGFPGMVADRQKDVVFGAIVKHVLSCIEIVKEMFFLEAVVAMFSFINRRPSLYNFFGVCFR